MPLHKPFFFFFASWLKNRKVMKAFECLLFLAAQRYCFRMFKRNRKKNEYVCI